MCVRSPPIYGNFSVKIKLRNFPPEGKMWKNFTYKMPPSGRSQKRRIAYNIRHGPLSKSAKFGDYILAGRCLFLRKSDFCHVKWPPWNCSGYAPASHSSKKSKTESCSLFDGTPLHSACSESRYRVRLAAVAFKFTTQTTRRFELLSLRVHTADNLAIRQKLANTIRDDTRPF